MRYRKKMGANLHQTFYYDAESPSGLKRVCDWVSGRGGCTVRARAGDNTGSLSSTKPHYCDVYDGTKLQRAHVVIWQLMEGEVPDGYVVDHTDGNSLNNLRSNLRLVTEALNGRNQKFRTTNASGTNGVHLKVEPSGERWVAQWNTLSSKRQQKSFSIGKYGNDEAFRLACEYRTKMIEELNLQGAGYTESHGIR